MSYCIKQYQALAICFLLLVVSLAFASIKVEAAPQDSTPNLQVTKLTISKTKVKLGDLFSLSAIIANFGDQPAHNVYIAVAATTEKMEVVSKIPDEPVSQLNKAEEIEFYAEARLKEAGKFKVGVMIIVDNKILSPPNRWVEVEVTSPPSSSLSPFTISGIALGTIGFASILGLALLKASRRSKIKKAVRGLATKASAGFALSRTEITLTLITFLAICLLFFAPYAFPSNPSQGVFLWIMRLYYPTRLVAPLALIIWYGLRVYKPWLAFLTGFCPLLLLSLTELSWKPFPAIMREDLYFGVALGLTGLGGAIYSRRVWLGVGMAVLGLILWFGGGASEGILWYIKFLRGGSLPY